MSPALKQWAGRLGLILGGLAMGVVLAEILGRVIQPTASADLLFNSPDSSPIGLYLNDPELLLTPTPGFSSQATSLGYSIPLRINQLGLRGPEVSLQGQAPGWLTVGDSFTLSVQVTEEDTFQGRLSETTGLSFWNAGVDGYSTWQALTRYKRLDPTLGSKAVLLTFFLGNDFHDNERFPHEIKGARHLEPGSPIPREPLPLLKGMFLRHSYLYAHWRVWNRQKSLLAGRDPQREWWKDELKIFSTEGSQRLAQLQRVSEVPLRDLQRETRRQGDRLLVAIAPPAFQIETDRLAPTFEVVGLDPAKADLSAPVRAIEELLSRAHISSCNLIPALEAAAATGEQLYFTYDGHWTPAGHRVVAEALAQCIGKRP